MSVVFRRDPSFKLDTPWVKLGSMMKTPRPHESHPSSKRGRPLKLAGALLALALPLTACGGANAYDDPPETSVKLATSYVNEEDQCNGDQQYNLEEVEEFSKQHVCDELPEAPTEDQMLEHSQDLADDHTIDVGTALALVIHGSGRWCSDKYDAAYE